MEAANHTTAAAANHTTAAANHIAAAAAAFSLSAAAPEGALSCTQRAGDVLYVPCDWGHGVLNVRPSVGVAVEFSWGHGQRG